MCLRCTAPFRLLPSGFRLWPEIFTTAYNMPQKKANIIIMAYRGDTLNWGLITKDEVRAALSAFQAGKRFLYALAHYLVVLYPPLTTGPPH